MHLGGRLCLCIFFVNKSTCAIDVIMTKLNSWTSPHRQSSVRNCAEENSPLPSNEPHVCVDNHVMGSDAEEVQDDETASLKKRK